MAGSRKSKTRSKSCISWWALTTENPILIKIHKGTSRNGNSGTLILECWKPTKLKLDLAYLMANHIPLLHLFLPLLPPPPPNHFDGWIPGRKESFISLWKLNKKPPILGRPPEKKMQDSYYLSDGKKNGPGLYSGSSSRVEIKTCHVQSSPLCTGGALQSNFRSVFPGMAITAVVVSPPKCHSDVFLTRLPLQPGKSHVSRSYLLHRHSSGPKHLLDAEQ